MTLITIANITGKSVYSHLFVHTLTKYLQAVFKSRGFNEMSEDALAFVLKSDKLRLDEEEILEKVLEWATVNSVRFTYSYL